jgi:hypothetical protein
VRTRLSILVAGLLVCAVSGLGLAAPSNAGIAAAGTASGGPTCPTDLLPTQICVKMPTNGNVGGGIIVAGPTQNLGLGQYVYLQLSGFQGLSGESALIEYCSDPNNAPLPPQNLSKPPPAPVCATTTPQYNAPPTGGVPIFGTTIGPITQGTAATSVETEEASPPGLPLPSNGPTPFFCDTTAANACDIVVTDFAITSPTDFHIDAANSVAIPLTFAPPASCPGAAQVTSESEYGIDVLTPVLAQLSCAQNSPSKAVTPLETAVGGVTAVSDLAHGNTEIAFTDDPEAADQQQSLKSGNFALIPVALSANTVGVDALIRGTGQSGTQPGINYPIDQMQLTPTMVAGEMTNQGLWPESYEADDIVACTGPSKANCGAFPCGVLGSSTACSLFDQLNYLQGYDNFFRAGSFMQEGTSGATDQLFTWLCNAPIVPINWGPPFNPQFAQPESQSGLQTLETGFFGKSGAGVTCPAGQDQVPGFTAPSNFFTYNNPETQNIKAPPFVVNQSGANAAAAFINQNWAEGEYYGVGAVAALQNAAGNFVTPSPTSLDAAVSVAKTNADGTLTPDYTSTNADAYPMPDVIYAAVSASPVPAAQAAAETAELTQMLELTGTGGFNVAQLPAGFVPMPASLVTQAQADIAKDIVAAPTPLTNPSGGAGESGGGTSGTGTTSTSSPVSPNVSGTSGLFGGVPFSTFPLIGGISPLAGLLANSLANAAAASAGHGSTGPLLGPALPAYALASNQGSTIVSIAAILGLIALLAGLLLMSSGVLSRIRSARRPLSTDGGEGGAEEAPSGAAAPA